MSDLAAHIRAWPASSVAVVVIGPDGVIARTGTDQPLPWASVTKLLTALTVLRLADAGELALDEPAGPPGATLRHLLAHASGLTLRGIITEPPGQRRIYSNAGYNLLAAAVEQRTKEPFADTLKRLVLDPLDLHHTVLSGPAAYGAVGPAGDLAALAHDLLAPRRLAVELVTRFASPAFSGLPGALPGYGEQQDNAWGLGPEIRAEKRPHWTAPTNSPRTFGHFGMAGGFVWVDPDARLACASLSDREFGPWAMDCWPRLSEYVLDRYR